MYPNQIQQTQFEKMLMFPPITNANNQIDNEAENGSESEESNRFMIQQ